jgi:hypothetical protein
MEKSPEIKELALALINFQREMKTVVFDASNPFFKSKYATLAQLVSASKDLLAKNFLTVSQLTEDEGAVTTILMHQSGQYISSKLTLKPVKDDPQGRGSCLTYARRYSYASILGLVADDDDDGNAASHGKKESPKESPKAESVVVATVTLKDRVIGTAMTKFKSEDKFQAWRVDHGLVESMDKATPTELNHILNLLREIK